MSKLLTFVITFCKCAVVHNSIITVTPKTCSICMLQLDLGTINLVNVKGQYQCSILTWWINHKWLPPSCTDWSSTPYCMVQHQVSLIFAFSLFYYFQWSDSLKVHLYCQKWPLNLCLYLTCFPKFVRAVIKIIPIFSYILMTIPIFSNILSLTFNTRFGGFLQLITTKLCFL